MDDVASIDKAVGEVTTGVDTLMTIVMK